MDKKTRKAWRRMILAVALIFILYVVVVLFFVVFIMPAKAYSADLAFFVVDQTTNAPVVKATVLLLPAGAGGGKRVEA
jgi:hypothetical protein